MSAPSTATLAEADPATDRRSVLRSMLPWVVTLAAVALAVFSTLQWRALATDQSTRAEVEAVAAAFLLELTTWDASDGLGDTRDQLASYGTGAFLDEVDELFGAELSAELRDVAATSEGEIQDVFLQRVEDDRAVVFGVVLQTQDTTETDPDTIARSARVVLERVDGTWKVSQVQMVDAGTTSLGDVTSGEEEAP